MAINKKLIHFNHKEDFLREKDTNNNILDTSIVFIKDTQELWTHGQYYKGLTDKHLEILNSILSDYKAVDLGLPSGTLWADRNIGAVNEYDGGKLFQWGDPTPYDVPKYDSEGNILTGEKQFNTSDYKWYPTGDNDNPSKYNYPDKKLILDLEDDPASINMGYNWNAPTIDNMKELLENTYQELYTNINGSTIKVASGTYDSSTKKGTWEYIDSYNSSMIISGNSYIKLVSKINSNFIIIPYWYTCSRGSCMTGIMLTTNKRASISDLNLIEAVSFNNTSYQIADVYERNIGMSVRGVTTSLSIINRYLADVRNTKLSYIDGIQITPSPVIIKYKNYEKDQYGNKGEDKTIVIPPAQAGKLSGVMTGSDKAKLDGIAQHADVSPVKSVNGRTGIVTGLAEASNVYTKTEVDQKVADAITGGQVDLSGYLTKTEAEDTYLTPTGLDQVLYDQSGDEGTTFGSTVADVNNLKDGIKNVYTKTESDSKYQPKGNYLTEHQDISGKANVGDSYTKTESDAKYLTEHQSLADYAKKSEIPAPYDDTVIKGRIATLEAIDHSQYLTEHQDISNLATKDEVSAKANSNDVYTKSEVDQKVADAVTGGQIDLSGYLTKTEAEDTYLTPTGLDQVLYDQSGDEGTTFGSTVADVNNLKDGIKNVYTKTESDSKYQPKGNYLTEHQDISGKANVGDSYTKTESDAKYLTEHQSLADYAKKSEIPAPYDDTVIKGRIATLEAIDHSQYLTEHQDISNLATKDEVSAKANSNDVYTKSQVDDMYSNAEGALNTIDQHLQNVTPGLNHIPSGGSEKQVLAYQSNGKAKWETLSNILPGMEDMLSYGVRWTPGQIDPQVERIGNMNLHRTLPIQSEMKGCIYKPKTKELSYWLNENDWRFRKKPIHVWIHFETPTIAVVLDSKYTQSDFAKGQYVKVHGHIGIITLVSTTSSSIKLTINWEEGSSIYPDIIPAGGLEIGSRLDGYDGEVMVHVPGFYIRSWEGENYNEVRISQTKIDDTWEYQPPCYVGAYRDTILVNKPKNMGYLTELGAVDQIHPISVANYNANCRGGANDASKDDLDDIFQRDLGKCITNLGRAPFRAWTRLSNKEIMSYIQYKNIIYWLYVIEYANFDSQETFTSELDSNGFHQGGLGNGIAGVQNWNTFNGGCPICVNGYTNNLGNRSGIKLILSDKINASSLSANRWRGIENPFGDVSTIVDGIISVDGNVYVTNNPEFYTDSASDISNLTFIGTVPEKLPSMIREYSLGHTAELVVKHTSGSVKNEGYKSDIVLGSASGLSFLTFGGAAYMTYQAGLGCQEWSSASQGHPQGGFRTIVVE